MIFAMLGRREEIDEIEGLKKIERGSKIIGLI